MKGNTGEKEIQKQVEKELTSTTTEQAVSPEVSPLPLQELALKKGLSLDSEVVHILTGTK